MLKSNKLLSLSIALAACMAAPTAFAQNAHANMHALPPATPAIPATPATPAIPAMPATPAIPQVKAEVSADAGIQDNRATPAVPATAAVPATKVEGEGMSQATPATPATPAVPAKKSWSTLDVDSNGSLSASEAASMGSLSKVFGKADADADGELTQDEYKAWLATSGSAKHKPKHGG